jgi:hypothetical protein
MMKTTAPQSGIARKQLFYLTNHELTAYSWHGAGVSLENIFENEESGWQRFADYLSDTQSMPAYFLVDLIEEDFQRDTVPHAVGKARQALIERRLTQLYRDTPFRHATPQGRDKEGRKDDRFLFSALTNAELPKPWLDAMLKHAVPLVGIYSLALLSQVLFNKLHLDDGPLLLVTHQSSGLRQSYFHEGYLRFSRLTPLFDHAAEPLADSFVSETAKTRQFLASTRLLGRGEKIQVVAIANVESLAAIQDEVEDTPDAAYRFIEIEEAQQLLKLKNPETAAACDPFFLSLLAGARIASHFPLRDQRHFYQLWQTRFALYAASGAIALAALIWAGIDIANIFEQRRETAKLEMEAVAAEYKYQAVVKNMPTTLVSPHNMKSIVDIERMIAQNVPSPEILMAGISKALDALPQIVITKLQWQVVDTSTLAVAADANAPPPPPPVDAGPQAALLGLAGKPSQIVILEGEVQPFKDDYRAALESVSRFAAELQKDRQLRAEITLQPLDTRPTVKLENSAGQEKKDLKARFAMKLTRKP